ncbi:MAG: hypothetical protein LLG06_01040 [Desulfobacteraceae bacterium]|nr:hypothetical protein [Desulfobacteraceae bacterium]
MVNFSDNETVERTFGYMKRESCTRISIPSVSDVIIGMVMVITIITTFAP